jgi:hypothetical protein
VTRIALPVFITIFLACSAATAACPVAEPNSRQAKAHPQADDCVNLGGVPQISANIVAAEPAPAVKAPTSPVPAATPYEGPTLGMAKPGVRSVPTIGYHWNLQ